MRLRSAAVRQGECFGLLGINGAGKTSTFRMLAGDARPSAGDARVLGRSVRAAVRAVHRLIGARSCHCGALLSGGGGGRVATSAQTSIYGYGWLRPYGVPYWTVKFDRRTVKFLLVHETL